MGEFRRGLVWLQVRTGPPKDDEADYALPVWAGTLPLSAAVAGSPEADPRLPASTEMPSNVREYSRKPAAS